jgi:hypothetical protein
MNIKAMLITPLIAVLLAATQSAMAQTHSQHYNTGYNDGWYKAQTDWNSGQYSAQSGGWNVCPGGHTKSYCQGYVDGYQQLWAKWTYNQAYGLNEVNKQSQSSDVTTNIKGNDNRVTNIINQGQATDSGNGNYR